jgi:hypothetical protein
MNPFEYFQKLKPEIEADRELMNALKDYAFNETCDLVHLGYGNTNTCFRLGKINDFWLATRENIRLEDYPEVNRGGVESYIETLLYYFQTNRAVPKICGGVHAKREGIEKYFLLLEDLTDGGNARFSPGLNGAKSGFKNGIEVFYDFQEDFEVEEFKYMNEEKMIILK